MSSWISMSSFQDFPEIYISNIFSSSPIYLSIWRLWEMIHPSWFTHWWWIGVTLTGGTLVSLGLIRWLAVINIFHIFNLKLFNFRKKILGLATWFQLGCSLIDPSPQCLAPPPPLSHLLPQPLPPFLPTLTSTPPALATWWKCKNMIKEEEERPVLGISLGFWMPGIQLINCTRVLPKTSSYWENSGRGFQLYPPQLPSCMFVLYITPAPSLNWD